MWWKGALILLLSVAGVCALANTDDPFAQLVSEIEASRKDGNMANAERLADDLETLARQAYSPVYVGDAHFQQARNAMERNQYDTARELLSQSIVIFQQEQDDYRTAKSQRQLGLVYRYMSDYGTAFEYLYQALDVFLQYPNEPYLSATYSSLGVVLEKMGQYEPAFENFQEALTLDYQQNDESGIASGLYNLGNIRREMGDLSLSLDYFEDALALDEKTGNVKDIAYSNNMIALNLIAMGEHEQARAHAEKALSLFRSIETPRDTDWALTILARIEFANDNKREAVAMINGVIERAELQRYRSLLLDAYTVAASFAFDEQRFSDAKANIDAGLELAKETNELAMQASFTELLVQLHLKSNDYKDAFDALQQQKNLDDEILDAKRLNGIAQMQAHSENVRKAHKIELLEKEKALQLAAFEQEQLQAQLIAEEKQRQVIELENDNAQTQLALVREQRSRQQSFMIFLVVFGVLTVVVFMLFHRRRMADLRAQSAKQLVERKNRMLSDVSHELRTPLTAIKLQVEMLEHQIAEDPKQIYPIIHNKIGSLNKLINSVFQLAKADSGDLKLTYKTFPLRAWLHHLVNEHKVVLSLNGLQLTSEIEVSEQQMFECDQKVIEQVIENLMSNSCRYTDTGGKVHLTGRIENHMLDLSIEDSSPGVEARHLPHLFERLYRADESRSRTSGGSGLGLSIVKAFVKAHHGKVRAVDSEFGGLKIQMRFPLSQPSASD